MVHKCLNCWHVSIMAGLGALLVGCATPKKYADYHAFYSAGAYDEARDALLKKEPNLANVSLDADPEPGSMDADYLLEDLMIGSADQMRGDREEAEKAFIAADRIYQDTLAQEGLVGGGAAQVGKVLTSDTSGMYRGRFYEGVMAGTYKAMEAWARGDDPNVVRMRFRQLSERQRLAAAHFKKQIEQEEEAAKKEAAENKGQMEGISLGDILQSKEMLEKKKEFFAGAYQIVSYSEYDNPFSHYIEGLYRMLSEPDDSSALEMAIQSFRHAYHVSGANAIAQECAIADALADQVKIKPSALNRQMWVILENGLCPIREEEKIILPVPIKGTIVTACLAWPRLAEVQGEYAGWVLRNNGVELKRMASVCNLDRVAAAEYKTELKGIWTRQTCSALIKCVVQYVSQKQMEKWGGQDMAPLIGVALGAGSAAITHADTRCWSSLPKDILVARVKIPEDGTVELWVDGAVQPLLTMHVESMDAPSVVWVKSPKAGAPLSAVVMNGDVKIK